MKRLILSLAAVLMVTVVSCKQDAADKVKAENVEAANTRDAQEVYYPTMDFEEKNYDFGTINDGDIVEHVFNFTNNGKAPLVITSARGSCGCTVPSYTKKPVLPGESGELLVKFNSRGRKNQQNKTISITANTESGKEILQIKAFVTPDPNATKTVSSQVNLK